ncbi:MAG: EF-hand domain-containing protein, partial [Parvibaculaceae bacterium]
MHGHHGMGMHRVRAFMERYDTNKDGKVTQDEINANRADWLTEFDTDKDGALTLQEFQSLWLKARHERMVREFQRFDRDGDGKVTLEEYQRPLSEIVERMDRNDDGAISKEDRKHKRWHRGNRPGDRDRDSDRGSRSDEPAQQDDDSPQSE